MSVDKEKNFNALEMIFSKSTCEIEIINVLVARMKQEASVWTERRLMWEVYIAQNIFLKWKFQRRIFLSSSLETALRR